MNVIYQSAVTGKCILPPSDLDYRFPKIGLMSYSCCTIQYEPLCEQPTHMKKQNLIIVLLLLIGQQLLHSQGDKHSLKILKDDPNSISDRIFAINGSHAQFSKRESIKAGIGLEMVWGLGSKLQVQSTTMFYYLALRNVQGPDYSFEGGLAYTLSSRSRTGDVKIILSHMESTTETSTQRITTSETKYLVSTGTFLSKTKVRTGLYLKQCGMEVGESMDAPVLKYTGIGVYGGLEFTKQACLFSEVDGNKGVTSGYTRIYIDGMFLPVSKFESAVNADDEPSHIGFRFGFTTYFNPNKRKNPEYGKLTNYQMYPSLFFKSEAGIRGGEGWFFNLGLGFMVHRNK